MKRHFSMLREFQLADWFTLANAFCGTGAVFAAMRFLQDGERGLLFGMALIPLAFIFDALDGRIARLAQVQLHPGARAGFAVRRDLVRRRAGGAGLCMWHAGRLGLAGAISLCGVSRLARYNTAEAMTGDEGKVTHFEGTPIPTSLVLVIVLAIAAGTDAIGQNIWFGQWQIGPWQLHPMVLLFALSGSLMISKTLRIPKP